MKKESYKEIVKNRSEFFASKTVAFLESMFQAVEYIPKVKEYPDYDCFVCYVYKHEYEIDITKNEVEETNLNNKYFVFFLDDGKIEICKDIKARGDVSRFNLDGLKEYFELRFKIDKLCSNYDV